MLKVRFERASCELKINYRKEMQENVRVENNDFWSCEFHFFKAGLWYFIIGIILGFGILIHYLAGSKYNTTADFLSNITLWFGSPLSLSAAYIQLGGLGMAVVGTACCFFHRTHTNTTIRRHKNNTSSALCHVGLIALFITGYIGYFVINMIWPGFYYIPVAGAKNLWLILQGLSILIYVIGLIMATCCLCKYRKNQDYPENVRA